MLGRNTKSLERQITDGFARAHKIKESRMRKMTRSQAKAFRDRWYAVAAAEAEERRSASLRLRWEQMNALRCLMAGLKLTLSSTGDQEKIVWERWARLKELPE